MSSWRQDCKSAMIGTTVSWIARVLRVIFAICFSFHLTTDCLCNFQRLNSYHTEVISTVFLTLKSLSIDEWRSQGVQYQRRFQMERLSLQRHVCNQHGHFTSTRRQHVHLSELQSSMDGTLHLRQSQCPPRQSFLNASRNSSHPQLGPNSTEK